jgi:hypothetical protein
MLLEDLEEAEAIAAELRRRHGRRIAVRRVRPSTPADLSDSAAPISRASLASAS